MTSTPSYRQAQLDAAERLSRLPHATPELEAALLLCHLLGQPRSHLFAWPEKRLTTTQQEAYQGLIQRRLAGEPIAHITGEREFWSLSLQVTPDTLIPRPDTELLVERALTHLAALKTPRIADLGTGSGAIALALASERPEALIHASEQSPAALAVARENARQHRLSNVDFFLGSWCQALPAGQFYDLIVSNPPYIEAADPHLDRGDLPREPRDALVSGSDGLEAIREIAAAAPARLAKAGWLLLEHGYTQGEAVRQILSQRGFSQIETLSDLAGRPRLTEGVTTSAP
ncbi:MAG: peptide chain release factor N(5)-glutamine methyltransferase [Candidatus Thiodiazotropha sp.]|jgi:release factor glutamine methyltransferase